MNILTKAEQAIISWNSIRQNNTALFNYLNQGSSFSITLEDFSTWELILNDHTESAYIHAYIGLTIHPGNTLPLLSLFCIDSHTDSLILNENTQNSYIASLKEVRYNPSLKSEMTFYEVVQNGDSTPYPLEKTFRWELSKQVWINSCASTDQIAQILKIPFKDLKDLFSTKDVKEVIMTFALTQKTPTNTTDLPDSSYPFIIDLILWGYNESLKIMTNNPQDIIKPCPPFGINDSNTLEFGLYAYIFD